MDAEEDGKAEDAVLGSGGGMVAAVGRDGRRCGRTTRWIWTRGRVARERRGVGKISAQGGVELTRPRGGGRLPYPLAGADEVVRRGVAPVATAPGEQGRGAPIWRCRRGFALLAPAAPRARPAYETPRLANAKAWKRKRKNYGCLHVSNSRPRVRAQVPQTTRATCLV